MFFLHHGQDRGLVHELDESMYDLFTQCLFGYVKWRVKYVVKAWWLPSPWPEDRWNQEDRGVDRKQVDLAAWWDYSTDHLFLIPKLHFAQEWIAGSCWLVPSCVSLGEVSTEDRKNLSLSIEIFLLRLELCVYVNVYILRICEHSPNFVDSHWVHKIWKSELRAFHEPKLILRYPWRVWNDSSGEDSSRYVGGSEGSFLEIRESSGTGARWSLFLKKKKKKKKLPVALMLILNSCIPVSRSMSGTRFMSLVIYS